MVKEGTERTEKKGTKMGQNSWEQDKRDNEGTEDLKGQRKTEKRCRIRQEACRGSGGQTGHVGGDRTEVGTGDSSG